VYTYRNLGKALVVALIVLTLTLSMTAPSAAAGTFQDVETVAYGTFSGVAYVKHTGTFVGTASGGSYAAPFEIIVPLNRDQGNRRILVEPYHPNGAAVIRDFALSPEFLFERGFGYAAVCFSVPWPSAPDTHPCQDFSGASRDGAEILAAFARALRADPLDPDLVGGVQKLYASGHSDASGPLHELLYSPLGRALFDLSIPVGVPWRGGTHQLPDPDAGRVMVLLAEADILNMNGAALRGTAVNYRSYEVAGAPHVIGVPDTTPLSWAPVMRALFIAGDRWATEVGEPPYSIVLADDATAIDGIARDENGNALGGIRLPDVQVGRGRFIAVNLSLPAATFGYSNDDFPKGIPLFGAFEDLKCVPRADGSARFPDHETYVQRFAEQAQQLVSQGYLLQADADHMIAEAKASDVGTPEACVASLASEMLPETGRQARAERHAEMTILMGLVSIAVGIACQRRVKGTRT